MAQGIPVLGLGFKRNLRSFGSPAFGVLRLQGIVNPKPSDLNKSFGWSMASGKGAP